ncbi:unnamed protein product [Boreogadus saida]
MKKMVKEVMEEEMKEIAEMECDWPGRREYTVQGGGTGQGCKPRPGLVDWMTSPHPPPSHPGGAPWVFNLFSAIQEALVILVLLRCHVLCCHSSTFNLEG